MSAYTDVTGLLTEGQALLLEGAFLNGYMRAVVDVQKEYR